jgi:hypothetical protein
MKHFSVREWETVKNKEILVTEREIGQHDPSGYL